MDLRRVLEPGTLPRARSLSARERHGEAELSAGTKAKGAGEKSRQQEKQQRRSTRAAAADAASQVEPLADAAAGTRNSIVSNVQ
jgi:hypothetical protein